MPPGGLRRGRSADSSDREADSVPNTDTITDSQGNSDNSKKKPKNASRRQKKDKSEPLLIGGYPSDNEPDASEGDASEVENDIEVLDGQVTEDDSQSTKKRNKGKGRLLEPVTEEIVDVEEEEERSTEDEHEEHEGDEEPGNETIRPEMHDDIPETTAESSQANNRTKHLENLNIDLDTLKELIAEVGKEQQSAFMQLLEDAMRQTKTLTEKQDKVTQLTTKLLESLGKNSDRDAASASTSHASSSHASAAHIIGSAEVAVGAASALKQRRIKVVRRNFLSQPRPPIHRPKSENVEKKLVRNHLKRLLKIKKQRGHLPTFPNPPSNDELAVYAKDHRNGPTIDNFRIDFSKKSMTSEWNYEAARVFARSYLDAYPSTSKENDDIETMCMTNLRSLWQTHTTAINGGKTAEQLKHAADAALRTRRKSLYETRSDACENFRELRPKSNSLHTLGVPGMSDDESDREKLTNEGAVYYIVKDQWRSDEIRRFMRVLDLLYLDMRYNELGRAMTSGSMIRHRIISDKTRNCKPIIKLPRNFYDEAFLNKLKEEELRVLQTQPAIDLTIPNNLKLRAEKRIKRTRSSREDDTDRLNAFEAWYNDQ